MSFVSEKQTFRIQNMHWGFETSNVYMAEKSRDRNSTLDHSIFQLHHLAKDRKQRDCFDWHFCPPCFRGLMSEHCGPSPHPKHVVWKGLDDLEMVLYFGLVFCLSFSPESLVSIKCGSDSGCRSVPLGRLSGAVSLSASLWKEESQYLWAFRDSVFLLCLSNGCSHFISFTKLEKQF